MSFCVESQLWLRSLERWFCIARHFNCKGIVFISRYIFSSFCVCLSVCACALFVCPGVGSWQVCFGSRTNGTKLCTHAQSVAVQGVRGLRVTQQTLICYSGSAVNLDLTAHPHRGETHTHRQTHTPCYLWGPVASDEFRLLDIKLLRLVCPKNQFIDSTSVKNDSFCFMIKLFFSPVMHFHFKTLY